MKDAIINALQESILAKQKYLGDTEQLKLLEEIVKKIIKAYKKGNKVIIFGNGGSAADAQHMAAELVGRFKKERKALDAVALTTNTSIITALSNDYSYDITFSRQLEACAKKGDVVFGISTSGNAINVIKAMELAEKIGCVRIGLTGKTGGKLKEVVDYCIRVPSDETPRIQELHITIIHIICELVEKHLCS
ncbi:MAG: D-sedoheptulose 7-phosphate isomerase [Endomicrobia bacterium]|nr:D-sedoheptulose 7-phosphate isomerase [Endomicrobiia bacterium]